MPKKNVTKAAKNKASKENGKAIKEKTKSKANTNRPSINEITRVITTLLVSAMLPTTHVVYILQQPQPN